MCHKLIFLKDFVLLFPYLMVWWQTGLWRRLTWWPCCQFWSCVSLHLQTNAGGEPCGGPGHWWPGAPEGRTEESSRPDRLPQDPGIMWWWPWWLLLSLLVSGIYLWGCRVMRKLQLFKFKIAFKGENLHRKEMSCCPLTQQWWYNNVLDCFFYLPHNLSQSTLFFITFSVSSFHTILITYYYLWDVWPAHTCSVDLFQTVPLLQKTWGRNACPIQWGSPDLDGGLAGQEVRLTL